jgi:Bacterial archaeo-eukaryotic release factor family 3
MKATALKQLDLEELRRLAHIKGPCVTLRVPDSHPGAADSARRAQLRQLTQTAVNELGHLSPAKTAESLADALRGFVETIPMGGDASGGPGFTVFVAPGHEVAFATPGVQPSAVAATHFDLLPLLAAASAPKDFYALGISRKAVRLWKLTPHGCEEVALPSTVPASIEAAEGVDHPDHHLQNRSTIGSNAGKMNSMRFGTVSDYDSEAEHLHHFFGMVSKGLRDVVRDLPVFLVGTRPDLLAFRKASHGGMLFEDEWHENPAHCSPAQVEAKARAAAAGELYRQAETAARQLPEIRQKIENDPAAIYRAAAEGRVHNLYVADSEGMAASTAHIDGLHANDDVHNAAAVETLRTGGTVFSLSGAGLPGGGVIAAVLRY